MEVNKYTDILGMRLDEDVVEGRMVLLTATGARRPTNAGEAALSKYLVAWPVDNREMPIYQPYPAYSRALRYGFDQADNTPFAATVFTTYPGLESVTRAIPSGTGALLYAQGEFTVASGQWVYDPAVFLGVELDVVATGANAGMLTIHAGGTPLAVCTLVDGNQNLRFRTYAE